MALKIFETFLSGNVIWLEVKRLNLNKLAFKTRLFPKFTTIFYPVPHQLKISVLIINSVPQKAENLRSELLIVN